MALLNELYGLIEKERYEGPNLRLLGDGYTLNRVEELAAAGKREEAERTARTLAHCPALLTEGLRTVAVYACLDGDTDDAERLGLELIGNNPADAYAAAVLLAVCREREDAPAAERYRALAARVEPERRAGTPSISTTSCGWPAGRRRRCISKSGWPSSRTTAISC